MYLVLGGGVTVWMWVETVLTPRSTHTEDPYDMAVNNSDRMNVSTIENTDEHQNDTDKLSEIGEILEVLVLENKKINT